jgi:isopentenyl diphosphate isomerase/L-lactate dehydrogenase-like FMN-dependent dehydrogenase
MTLPPYAYREGDTADDLCEEARGILPRHLFDHVFCGAGDERTVAANRAGFGRYRLVPRLDEEVRCVDLSTEILGTRISAPIYTCPMAGIDQVHVDGDRGIARAAARTNVLYVPTAWPGVTTEEVAAAAGPARWQQLYWQPDRVVMEDLVHRAEDAGYRAIVLTVDIPVSARRPRMVPHADKRVADMGFQVNLRRYTSPEWRDRVAFTKDGRIASKNGEDVLLTWKNVAWLRSRTHLPFGLKGIQTPDDALRAIDIGANVIFVSTHGGRSLDGEPGAIELLEEIVSAVDSRVPVMLDSGVRRATDIAIALGLGAAAVGIGRPLVWALACGGGDVVTAYLSNLIASLRRTLAQVGAASIAAISRAHVSEAGRFLSDAEISPFLSAG